MKRSGELKFGGRLLNWMGLGLFVFMFNLSGSAWSMLLYDDFSGKEIDPGKWMNYEAVREIQADGKLHLKITARGQTLQNFIIFNNILSPQINYIEADVSPQQLINQCDQANPPNCSNPAIYLVGIFYNDGRGSSGNSTGDVGGRVRFQMSNGQLMAGWMVNKSLDSSGSQWQEIGSAVFTDPVALGQTYKLSILWEAATKTFTFGVNGTTQTWTADVGETINPPVTTFKAIGASVFLPNSSLSGTAYGTIDNVIAKETNNSPAPLIADNFSSPLIDTNLWATNGLEFVREIRNGSLVSKTRAVNAGIGTKGLIALNFINPENINQFKAKVSLNELQATGNSRPRARLSGFFYNTTPPVQHNGYLNEVFAAIEMGGASTGRICNAYVIKFTSSDGSDYDILYLKTLFDPVALGDIYTLFLKWDGTRFTFKARNPLGTEIVEQFNPLGPFYGSEINSKRLDISILCDAGLGCANPYDDFVAATFDDVELPYPNHLYLPVILK